MRAAASHGIYESLLKFLNAATLGKLNKIIIIKNEVKIKKYTARQGGATASFPSWSLRSGGLACRLPILFNSSMTSSSAFHATSILESLCATIFFFAIINYFFQNKWFLSNSILQPAKVTLLNAEFCDPTSASRYFESYLIYCLWQPCGRLHSVHRVCWWTVLQVSFVLRFDTLNSLSEIKSWKWTTTLCLQSKSLPFLKLCVLF